MLGLVLLLEWRRREFGEPTRMPGGESIVTLGLTERPEGCELSRPGRILFCVD
jgi:hypothetical protein